MPARQPPLVWVAETLELVEVVDVVDDAPWTPGSPRSLESETSAVLIFAASLSSERVAASALEASWSVAAVAILARSAFMAWKPATRLAIS